MIRVKHYISNIAISIMLIGVLLATQISISAGVPTTASTTASTVETTTSRYDNPLVEHKHERNCKALCEHCGCLGFYCGEECICECNNENSDTECIHTMQVNARTLNTPFEILIQGPSSNRFVRNAKEFEQKRELVVSPAGEIKAARSRRSTITIYKPSRSGDKRPALSLNALESPSTKEDKSNLARHKRSVEHLEWFNDFASSLVRPSPLGTRAQKQRETKRQAAAAEPMSMGHREPWFLEQTAPLLNRPAPLFKRHHLSDKDSQRARKSKKSFSRNTRPDSIEEVPATEASKPKPEIRPFRDALQVVERIPRVLQDTVSHLAADDDSGDVFSLNIMNDVLPKKIPRKGQTKGFRRFRQNVRDKDVEPKPTPTTRAPVVPPPLAPLAPLAPRGLLLPWLRQRRLRRFRGEQ
ncbi:uncharacterized protein LOC6581781 [Drosophila mojavensis]|uniref:Uncharacterized protein n=1 Tax=Drosophila mojavensis TaxID=7230 RepID=B4KZW7_DROMO|nr:uncharacterized protein LOC6581781 [Drosophila mojavensis]EDW17979.1 uncharacterized protein Dmoj_GI12355 [Drosophila mojavensis]